MRPTFDETYLEMASVLSKRAACTRRQVGALLVGNDTFIIAAGYNGAPAGQLHCTDGGCPRGLKSYSEVPAFSRYENCVALHAEHNALDRAGTRATGATMYITCAPCDWCIEKMKDAKIKRVVYPEGEMNYD